MIDIDEILRETNKTNTAYVRGVSQTLARVCMMLDNSPDRERIGLLADIAQEWRDRRNFPMAFLDALQDEARLRSAGKKEVEQ